MSEFLYSAPLSQRRSIQEIPYKEESQSNSKNKETMVPPAVVRSTEEALDQIDRILHQMLLLAELSASNANVDRELLQGVLERMKARIDQIADSMENS